ncbi:MAG: exodeoxyribonuclease V subunit beta [Luteimonas sp.]
MSADAPRDAYLDLTLHGVRLIEASAGTGKTFTLATLVTRLVVERGLRVGQILAVTFTEAATQELRKRIRERLQLALDLIDAAPADDEKADAALTRQLLQSHRESSGESDTALRRRLRQATLEIDLAAIFTIHGFCARALREHALESGQGFDPPELLTNGRELREALAADVWRSHASDEAGVDDLAALWSGGHAVLAGDLPALLREPVLLPPAPEDQGVEAALAQRALAEAGLQQSWLAHGEAFLEMLAEVIDADVMNRGSYKLEWLADLRDWLRTFGDDPRQAGEPHAKLEKLTVEALKKGTKKDHAGRTPASSHFNLAVTAYLDAKQVLDAALARRRAAMLHRIRDDARARLATLKRQRRVQTYDDLIDGVADALDGPNGDALAQRLREQYRVALVDEFQDTDARQWKIFDRVFGSGRDEHSDQEPALFLIGDPKQAIYGFRGGDVHAYLTAGKVAERAPPLSRNFRSRPSLLAAIDALYEQAGKNKAFIDERIEFHDVEAGGKRYDGDFRRNGPPASALTVWRAPETGEVDAKGKPKAWSAPASRDLATQACVAAIHGVLSDARDHKATIEGEPVQPGDIAVLVRSHREATMVQRALALAGVPAVAAGKQSLFSTTEARDLHALLLALLHTGDDGRLRAALSTVLVGVDAPGIDALGHPVEQPPVEQRPVEQPPAEQPDSDARHNWQQRALGWRERLLRGGPLALVGDLCAAQAPRLLGLLDGERRLSNYLQLAEMLQEAQERALGLHGLVDWLGRRIATADVNDETQLLRLESDARRVQIVTLHKSKGLEYPLVFLPFVGIGRNEPSPGSHCVAWDDAQGRRLHWKLELPEAEWEEAKTAWKTEQRAEDARLLYVGLTRAEHALWIAAGPFFASDKTPLAKVLADPDELARMDGIVFDDTPPPQRLPRLPPESDAAVPAARAVTRRLSHDWWVHSFSQLARADAGDATAASTLPAAGGNDEPDAPDDAPADTAFDPRFAGNRYGVALHAALEHADFAAWRDWTPGAEVPAGEDEVIVEALGAEGYGADVLDDGLALTTQLVGQTLTVALPEGVHLCDLPAAERRAEIEFQFSLRPVQVDALLRLLHAHGVVRDRHGFGLRQRLEGLMTGLIDLTYRHDGRWYVLDYKSNRLPGYDAAHLARAMAHSEYDLQALIYTLALHRWLRFRLGDGYDYARDFGGIRYLFCRGLDAARGVPDDATPPGIHAQRFTPELVHALDALFGGTNLPPPRGGEGRGGGNA